MFMNYASVCNPYSGFSAPVNGTSATECAEKALFSGLSRHVLHYGLGIKDGRKIDPACGSGGMFVQTGDFVNQKGLQANNTMTFYGQEKVEYNAQLCLMNMAVHGLTGVIKCY